MDAFAKLTGRAYRLFDYVCLLYTSDAADERSSVDLGGRRIIKKKKRIRQGRERDITRDRNQGYRRQTLYNRASQTRRTNIRTTVKKEA